MAGLIDYSIIKPELANSLAAGFQQSLDRQQAQAQQQAQQQRQNALADLELRSAQRGEEEALAEREAYKNQAPLPALRAAGLGKQALAYEKQKQERQAASIKQAKDALDLIKFSASQIMRNPNPAFAKQKILGLQAQTGQDMTNEIAVIDSFGNDPAKIKQWAAGHAIEADKLLPKFETRDVGGAVQRQGYDPLTGAPLGVAQVTQKTATPGERMTDARARQQMAQSERQFQATPTVTQIVDPTDPNKMLSIDARRYQGGGAGAPGVIGVSGKEPGAALRQNKVEAGKTQLADDLDNLRASFQKLDQMRAIPSTERGGVSNIGSAGAASGMGQMLGRAVGTEAQVERDVINSARMRLVNSIKNATGMSAQQLNSNVELQSMLKSISDPGQSVQAAMRIIDDIENAYVKGAGKLPKRGEPAAPAAGGGNWKDL